MDSKLILLIFLLLLTPSSIFASFESEISVVSAQCAKYNVQNQCEFDQDGNPRIISLGGTDYGCEWRENQVCLVNSIQEREFEIVQKQKMFFNAIYLFAFIFLVFLSVFLMYLKFGKLKILKIIYGLKFLGMIAVLLVIFFNVKELILILYLSFLIAPILSIYALWKSTQDQTKVKIGIIVLFLLELIILALSLIIPTLNSQYYILPLWVPLIFNQSS